MPTEQFSSSEFTRSTAASMPDFELTPRTGETIVPIEVFQARQAIAAAVASAPASSLERNKGQTTVEKIAPQKAIARVTSQIVAMRKDLDAETIGLYDDDEIIANEILGQVPEVSPADTKDQFDLTA